MERFFAHARKNEQTGELEYQSTAEHSYNVGNLASMFLSDVGLSKTGRTVGIGHDLGKLKEEFLAYMRDVLAGKDVRKGSVVHSFAALEYLMKKAPADSSFTRAAMEMMSYVCAAHHGFFDIDIKKEQNGFDHRIGSGETKFDEVKANFFDECMDEDVYDQLIDDAVRELSVLMEKCKQLSADKDEMNYYNGLCMRLVESALMDADSIDTARFKEGEDAPYTPPVANWGQIRHAMEHYLNSLDAPDTPINKARSEISDKCYRFARRNEKLIRLDIPTGGGKTYSSVRFALKHAEIWGKKHVIYTAPLLSILEQNADDIRKVVGDTTVVLEHQSNIVLEKTGMTETSYEWATSTWDAPIIVTTMVQLLNTMFSGKRSSIRRFHTLANSVIIIDEVQNVPIKMLGLFNLMVNFLTEVCNTTVVLCSATQPAFQKVEHKMLRKPVDMVGYDEKLWKVFERTEFVNCNPIKLNTLPDFVERVAEKYGNVLVICNTKKEAKYLNDLLQKDTLYTRHISAAMYPKHRTRVITDLKEKLANPSGNKHVVCVSTQVLQAGVNISFKACIRIEAGVDDAVQTAGRGNRNGELSTLAPVFVVRIIQEDLYGLDDIKTAQRAYRSMMVSMKRKYPSENFRIDSDEAVELFYSKLYQSQAQDETNYPVPDYNTTLFDLMGTNKEYRTRTDTYIMHQALKTAGELFSVFDEDTTSVIVCYEDEAKRIAQELLQCPEWAFRKKKQLLQDAKQYCVSVYSNQLEKIEERGGIAWVGDREIALLSPAFYDPNTGVVSDPDDVSK